MENEERKERHSSTVQLDTVLKIPQIDNYNPKENISFEAITTSISRENFECESFACC